MFMIIGTAGAPSQPSPLRDTLKGWDRGCTLFRFKDPVCWDMLNLEGLVLVIRVWVEISRRALAPPYRNRCLACNTGILPIRTTVASKFQRQADLSNTIPIHRMFVRMQSNPPLTFRKSNNEA